MPTSLARVATVNKIFNVEYTSKASASGRRSSRCSSAFAVRASLFFLKRANLVGIAHPASRIKAGRRSHRRKSRQIELFQPSLGDFLVTHDHAVPV
jgi:hypothetical protein